VLKFGYVAMLAFTVVGSFWLELVPFDIPLEEYLFFIIVPMAAIMTIEGVRSVKKHWIVGDEQK